MTRPCSQSPGRLAGILSTLLLGTWSGSLLAQPPQQPAGNRLANSSSLYLRQHRHNPVDWFPWGEEAFAKAKREQKPILLSIGFAACHWCHVMERESYLDETVAAYLNEHYVCIKVDREERPDIDDLYLTAVQAMGQDVGWPLHAFLLPDGRAFYGGTYFPPKDAFGRPGFRRVLEHCQEAFQQRRDELERVADSLLRHLQDVLAPELAAGELPAALLDDYVLRAVDRFDAEAGGFGQAPQWAPKFPPVVELQLLLRRAEPVALAMAAQTLQAMRRGGLWDQLGHGFHRYSTDRHWRIPHFEKMLHDNAQLATCYLLWAQAGEVSARSTAAATLAYLQRELLGEHGGFFASQDADSDGGEGKFFTWTRAELEAVLGDDAELAALRYGLDAGHIVAGRSVLQDARSLAELASKGDGTGESLAARLERARTRLLAARAKRPLPRTDEKVITAWHGLALTAFAQAALVLGDSQYLATAQRAADFAVRELVDDGRCLRSWQDGQRGHAGTLEDHALLALGLLQLFSVDSDPRWLAAAAALGRTVVAHFAAADGSFHQTADDQSELLLRSKSLVDGPLPSGGGAAALLLLQLGTWLVDDDLYARGLQAIHSKRQLLQDAPMAMTSWLLALQFHREAPREVLIAGEPTAAATQALLAAARQRFGGAALYAVVHDGNRAALQQLSPAFADKLPVDGKPAAYVCRRGVCAAPVLDPAAWSEPR